MIRVKKSIQAEEVLLKSEHVLFVEGKDSNSVDPEVLRDHKGQSNYFSIF